MARKKRLCVKGAFHHITARVIKGQKLCVDQQDKQRFLQYLKEYLNFTGFLLFSIQLYDNHYHMILRINHLPLEALLRGFHSAYARYYNKKYGLSGYFFQGRAKSFAIEDGKEIRKIIFYANSGPLRAGQCKSLEELDVLPGATHSAIMGFHQFPFLKTSEILSVFRDNQSNTDPKVLYRQFISQGLANLSNDKDFFKLIKGANSDKQDRHEPGYWVIGSTKFIRDAIALDRLRRIRVARYKLNGLDHDKLADYVVSIKKIPPEDLKKRGYGDLVSESRKLFCYLATRVLEMSSISTANHLNISSTAALRLARGGKIIAEKMKLEFPVDVLEIKHT